jgi:hypothetical protein
MLALYMAHCPDGAYFRFGCGTKANPSFSKDGGFPVQPLEHFVAVGMGDRNGE